MNGGETTTLKRSASNRSRQRWCRAAHFSTMVVFAGALAGAATVAADDADEEAGELPKAFVVLAPDQQLSEDDVKAFVAEKVATYKQLRIVEFIDQIPKSASGKILRRFLRDGTHE